MKFIKSINELEKIYGSPSVASLRKVSDHITPTYRKWIQASSLCTLATVGPNGVDASPRGDNSNVVRELNEKNLLIPDWRGNNRIDSLRNIVNDPRASLMLIVGGANIVIRINGTAKITLDEELIESFEKKDDPVFFAIISKKLNKAIGIASYLRINPADGLIEVVLIERGIAIQSEYSLSKS